MWKILLGIDGSEAGRHAVTLLQQLDLPSGSQIQVSTVVRPSAERRLQEAHVDPYEAFAGLVARTSDELRRDGLKVTGAVLEGQPEHALVEEAGAIGANLVVVGSRGLTGVPGLLLGSVARYVAHHAPCSVLVARPLRHHFQRVLLGTDGSTDAAKALDAAVRLPFPQQARFTVATVLRPPTSVTELPLHEAPLYSGDFETERTAAAALTQNGCRLLREASRCASPEVLIGDPAQQLLKLGERQEADLVLLGARGISVIERLLVGSVADSLLISATCSVLIAR